MAYERQQISITKEDFDLIPYYKSKPNFSKFILNCIRDHKEREERKHQDLDEERIIEIIENYLAGNKKNEHRSHKFDQDVASSIKNILQI